MQFTKHRKQPRLLAPAIAAVAMLAAPSTDAGPPPPGTFTKDVRLADEGDSLAVSASVFGLDRKRDAYVELRASARLELGCYNPAGKRVPAQTPPNREIDLQGFAYYPRFAIKFGRLDVYVDTDESQREIPGAPDCPNPNWTEKVEEVRFLASQLTIRQGHQTKLNLVCTFDPPTKDGKVPNSRVNCFEL